jgi:hypothetical protein
MYDGQNYSGGDGSSFEQAIKVLVDDPEAGVAAEYAYLSQHFAGYDLLSQALADQDDRKFDVFRIVYAGMEKEVIFDISGFFGKGFDDFIANLLK